MKNKILIASLLFVFILAGSVNAAGTGNNSSSSDKGQQQAQDGSGTGSQVQNQGEETQLQENFQIQVTTNGNDSGNGSENGIKVQEKQQLQDGSEAGSQVQNQGEENQIKNNSDNDSQQRKSRVASAVQEMLQVSERNGGIGEQVRVVAQSQNQNQVELESILEKVQSRNNFAKFFIGSDYKAIDNAEAILEQSNQQIQELVQIQNQLENEGDQQILAQQIQLLENVNAEIESALDNSQTGFSLLGWMFKFFSN